MRSILVPLLIAVGVIALGNLSEAQENLSRQVLTLFEQHCAECHDAARGRPKAGFGYVLDLEQLASDDTLIVPFEPDKSDLFKIVKSDQMPKNKPPLSPEEKELLRQWIASGAPAQIVDMVPQVNDATDAGSLAAKKPVAYTATLPMPLRLIKWLGKFHPLVIHFPIALMVAAFLAELLGIFTKRDWYYSAGRYCIALGALGAVASVVLGWALAGLPVHDDNLLAIHRWLGTLTAIWAVAAFVISEKSHRGGVARLVALRRLMVFLGAVMVSLSGHFGGLMVFGIDYFKW